MRMKFRCTACRQKLRVDARHVGRQVRCTRCKRLVTVPADGELEDAPPVASSGVSLGTASTGPGAPPPRAEPIARPAGEPASRQPAAPRPMPPAPEPLPEPVPVPEPLPVASRPPAAAVAPPRRAPAPRPRQPVAMASGTLRDYGARFGFVWGIVLLVGFFLPIVVPSLTADGPSYELRFPNLALLKVEGLPSQVKFLLLYPAIAGVCLVVLSKVLPGVVRALVVAGIGLFFWIYLVQVGEAATGRLAAEVSDTLGRAPAAAEARQAVAELWQPVVAFFSLVGLFVGLRIVRGSPRSSLGRLVAGLSGIAFLVLLVTPMLPREMGSVPAVALFKGLEVAIEAESAELITILGLLILTAVLFLAAAVMGCVSLRHDAENDPPMAGTGAGIVRNTAILMPVVYVVVITAIAVIRVSSGALPEGTRPRLGSAVVASLVYALPIAIKAECLLYGLFAPIIVGLIDLYAAVLGDRLSDE